MWAAWFLASLVEAYFVFRSETWRQLAIASLGTLMVLAALAALGGLDP